MNIRLFIALCLVALFFAPLDPHAQDQSDGTLHVLRPSINAEQDKAEFCLELDHSLDLSDRNRILGAIHLQSESKTVQIAPANVSISATTLCLLSLAHEEDYSLTITDLRGAHGEKLTEPYKLSFTIPDRTPALAFAGDPGAGNLPHYRDSDPVLRAVNVERAKIMLYRLSDPARMADAYRQRMQTTLAPSESMTFAKDNGQLVWQGEFTLIDNDDVETANQGLERQLPLRKMAGSLTPGLYLVVAADEAAPAKLKKSDPDLGPLAAQWFLYSDLSINVFSKSDGYYVETQNADSSAIAKNVKLMLLNHEQQTIMEGKSDANGTAFLAVPQDKRGEAASIVGLTEAGDVDFADLSSEDDVTPEGRYTLPGMAASITSDRPFYMPGEQIYLTLTARNIHGEAVAMPNSTLQLLRPDHTLYTTMPVPDGKAGVAIFPLSAPLMNGKWQLQWQHADGHSLAQAALRVTSNKLAPRIEASTDQTSLDSGGDINLSVKSKTDNGKPASYISGHVYIQWTAPDILASWSDYHFGNGEKTDETPVAIASFLTDAGGIAQLHMNAKPPSGFAPLHTANITVQADPVLGALDPDPIALPVKPDNYVIGIKPLAPDGKFAENSLARFDVLALGGDNKRRDAPGLKYQIYEEGRNFSWYQSEGRWEYKQLQQRRRMGGGLIDVKATGANFIRWRVTAGSYTLEITNADGTVLARYRFDAGWGLLKESQTRSVDLKVTADQTALQPKTPAKINFTLDHPGLVSIIIADDHIRTIAFETREAGNNEFTFVPEDNWGNQIRIRAEAKEKTDNGTALYAGQIDLPVRQAQKEPNIILPEGIDHTTGGQEFTFPIAASNLTARPTILNILPVPVAEENAATATLFVPPMEIDNSGKAVVHVPVPQYSGDLRFKMFVSNQSQLLQRDWSIPVRQVYDVDLSVPSILREGDTEHLTFGLRNNGTASDTYRYVVTTAAGLKTNPMPDGKIAIPERAQKIFPFDLTAQEAGAKELKLDVANAHDLRFSHLWPVAVIGNDWTLNAISKAEIAPQQSWAPASREKKREKMKSETLLFLSPQPLFEALQILGYLIAASPFTTTEMVAWYQVTQLWQDALNRTGYLPAAALQARQKDSLERLYARQKLDGSFPVLPGCDSDLVSTAAALRILASNDPVAAKPAADAATGWLRQRLSNTWFDETERPARAAAFASLAATDRLDVSSLRYFAETSTDKTLPPLAMAQLSAALAKSGDNDKAGFWLKALHDQLAATPALLPAVAENPLSNPQDLLPILQKLSADLTHSPAHDIEAQAAFLHALWVVNMRSGNWTAEINGINKTQNRILVIDPLAKSIRNSMDRALFITEGERTPLHAEKTSSTTRHIYQMDGNERAANELGEGETYIVTLEGSRSGESRSQKLLVHDATGSALSVVGCTLDADMASWTWLKNLSPFAASACEAGANGIDAVLPAADKDSWRIAYLVKAGQAGSYSLQPATVRTIPGNEWVSSGEERIEIK